MNGKVWLVFVIGLLVGACNPSDQLIDLSGEWVVRLGDPNGPEYPINLPGTTDEARIGELNQDTAYGILSREYEFMGKAWYSREITIPKSWEGMSVQLFLERVLWESQVFIDEKPGNKQDGLGTPHLHDLGKIKPGKHLLTVQVDNEMMHNIGDKGHAYGEYMQSIWNGIVGRIELRAYPDIRIEGIKTFPDPERNSVEVRLALSAACDDALVTLKIKPKNGRRTIISESFVSQGDTVRFSLHPNTRLLDWDEFQPNLYELEAILKSGNQVHRQTTTFGMTKVSRDEHHIWLNGKKIFLRGNLDCIHFPSTGYPSTEKQDWLRIFKIYQDYGLNHVRFHSWCPPEAAFEAADELGIYIQAEASVWIDWWMGTDMVSRGRPEMETKGHPQGIGRGDEDADAFIRAEMNRVIEAYGNHPSFLLFCIGNELGTSDFNLMGQWIRELKEMDPRRLYAASTARTITEWCEYSATHSVPGIGGVRQRLLPATNWDYEDRYSQALVPIIAHEVGQWPVYPVWEEIGKYQGVLKPRYLEQLANLAIRNGVANRDSLYRKASGALSALLYKDEIESFMRTASCGGFQLLSMQDYIGQGEALIGWLDSFYDQKGNLDPETARQFLNEVVPLAELPGYWFRQTDTVDIPVRLFQFSADQLVHQIISWSLKNDLGEAVFSGSFDPSDYSRGEVLPVGKIVVQIPDDLPPGRYQLDILLNGTAYHNSWPVWIYPKEVPLNKNEVMIANEWNDSIAAEIQAGAKVLLIANQIGNPEYTTAAAWKPLYWSASFFPGQAIETLGSVVQQDHPALRDFASDPFTSWNWYRLCQEARCFDLKDFPIDFRPIVEPVSDFHYCRRLGSLFELSLGSGKLLVCGYNVVDNPNHHPEINQLLNSLLTYMNSADFNPSFKASVDLLDRMFNREAQAIPSNSNNPQSQPGGNRT